MIKIYITGAISNIPKKEYKAKFDEAKQQLKSLGFIPVSPIDLPHQHADKWEEYMREDITAMLQCHGIYALTDYHTSIGAFLEVDLAQKLKMPIIYQRDILRDKEAMKIIMPYLQE